MTVKEAILSYPGLSDFPTNTLEILLMGRTLDGAAQLGTIEMKSVSLVIADALSSFVNIPDFTENKLSVSYPRSYFIKTAQRLYRENGEPKKANEIVGDITVPRGKATDKW